MDKVTVYCVISGSTPEIADNLRYPSPYGPIVTGAIESLADQHELSSQDDLCVIAPTDPSGHPSWQDDFTGGDLHRFDPDPERDVRVISHCVMGDSWDMGFVDGPPHNEQDENYLVSYGHALMVQTYALDIMALATHGRMTPLRLWRLAMKQGFEGAGRPYYLEGVDYGAIAGQCEQFPEEFPRFEIQQILELEDIGDAAVVKQRLIHEGHFWVWMAPDRFPVSPTQLDSPLTLPALEVDSSTTLSAIESLPAEVLIPIISSLPLPSLLNFASVSRSLRTAILGDDYFARVWIHDNAPWWIPVPTQTPKKAGKEPQTPVFLASRWSADFQLSVSFPTGLDWAYIMRCIRSGSMLNRQRIWNSVLDIEHAADLAGV